MPKIDTPTILVINDDAGSLPAFTSQRDVNMPGMDGCATAEAVSARYL